MTKVRWWRVTLTLGCIRPQVFLSKFQNSTATGCYTATSTIQVPVSPPHISTAISSGQGQAAAIQLSSPATHVLWTYSWLKTDSWHSSFCAHVTYITYHIFWTSGLFRFKLFFTKIHLLIVAFSLTLCTSINPTVSTHFPPVFFHISIEPLPLPSLPGRFV